jgi:hypothetical protein
VKGTKTLKARKKGKKGKDKCMTQEIPEYLGRECKRKKKDLDVKTRREKTGMGQKEGKEGAKCAMRRERETIEHMWNGCSEMRERQRKERGETLDEDGREIG